MSASARSSFCRAMPSSGRYPEWTGEPWKWSFGTIPTRFFHLSACGPDFGSLELAVDCVDNGDGKGVIGHPTLPRAGRPRGGPFCAAMAVVDGEAVFRQVCTVACTKVQNIQGIADERTRARSGAARRQ